MNTFCRDEQKSKLLAEPKLKKLRPKSQDSKRNYSANSVFSTGLESFCGGRLQRRVGGHIQPKMFA